MKIQAILFDCDGVVIDTDYSYRKIVSDLLTNKFNYKISVEQAIKRWNGKNANQIARELFFEGHDFAEEFLYDINELSKKYVIDENIIVPNLRELLKQTENLSKAICSNGRSERIKRNLRQVNLEHEFDIILGRDIIGGMKPNPEVYLQGAEKLGVDISKCIVIEDSALGLQAGIKSGAITVGFTGTGTSKQELESINPDYIINDLLEINNIIKQYK